MIAFFSPATVYAQDDSKCQFWKVDVDKCAGVSRANQVRGMPTFKIFQNAVEVDQLVGWDADALEAKIKRCVKIVAPTEVKEAEVVSADKSS